MNSAQKKVLSIAAGLVSIVFTIVSLCTATVAWFSINNEVSASGMSVRCKESDAPINLTYDVLKFNDDTKLGESYGQTPSAIELPEYDSYISKKNEYANVILRLEATFSEGLATTDYVAFDIDCAAELFKTFNETTYIDDQTSNVIQFKSVIYSYTFVDETTPPSEIVTASITDTFSETPAVNNDARYKSATTYFESLYTSTVYVSPDERNSSKITDKIVTLMPEIGPRSSVIESIVLYLELSYNFGLADNYIDTRLNTGSTSISLNGDINDLSFYTTSTPATLDSITLSTNSVSLVAGNSTSVSSTSSGDVIWRAAEDTGSVTLSNPSNTGATIYGVNAGHAIVSATTGQASVYLDAEIARAVVAAVQLNKNSLNGLAGGNSSLSATPYNFSDTVTYSWSTDNSNVATVSSSGNPATVNFIDTGTTTITCTATDGTNTAYATCSVSVIHPTVTLNQDNIQGNISDIETLIATASNFSGTVTYSWASSDEDVVTVNNNNSSTTSITFIGAGSATITVTASVGGTEETASDTCLVNVVDFALNIHKLVGEEGDSGTLTATAAGDTGLTGTLTYTWSTDDSSVATYTASSNSATINYVGYGEATITVEVSNGTTTLSDSCDVLVGKLTLDKSNIYAMKNADNGTLTATLNGISDTASYSFSSGTTSTATVSNSANVATIDYLDSGTTVITCTATYSDVTFTATATVYVAHAYLNNTTLSGIEGNSGTTTVTTTGFTGTIQYSVTSSDNDVATGSMNSSVCTISYLSPGTANITITVNDGNVSTALVCSVTVNSSSGPSEYTDVISMGAFGGTSGTSYITSLTTDTTKAVYTLVARNFIPNNGQIRGNSSGTGNFQLENTSVRSGYYIKSVTINRSSGSGTLTASSSRTLINWGTSALSTSLTTGTAANTTGSNLTTVTWTNTNTAYQYFLITNLQTSGSFYANPGITIVWGII